MWLQGREVKNDFKAHTVPVGAGNAWSLQSSIIRRIIIGAVDQVVR
jgi:hypothetical protein